MKQPRATRPTKRARPSRALREDRKVYVGFWTWPETKTAIWGLAAENRQSASAYIDGVIENHVLARKRRRHIR